MRVWKRSALVTIGIALVLLASGVSVAPTGCFDCCDDDDGSACADCPLCSPGRAPMLLGQAGDSVAPVPGRLRNAPRTRQPVRVEERGVFHVPRHLA